MGVKLSLIMNFGLFWVKLIKGIININTKIKVRDIKVSMGSKIKDTNNKVWLIISNKMWTDHIINNNTIKTNNIKINTKWEVLPMVEREQIDFYIINNKICIKKIY